MSAQLERIIAEGADTSAGDNWIKCADGFRLSVVAGSYGYCAPRGAAAGPYTKVEVGFPSERPEPWEQWSKFAEQAKSPTETVYGYVPVDMVRALVELHGGAA